MPDAKKLDACPICQSKNCFVEEIEGLTTYFCCGCGYTTNSRYEIGSEYTNKALDSSPQIIKESAWNDSIRNLVWIPTVLQTTKGMIFPEPIKDTNDWGWTVVKAIPIPEDEQHKYPDPTNPGVNYKNKMDMKNLKRYDKLCFMDAAEELGMFVRPIEINED